MGASLAKRYWAKVDKRDGCWGWLGARSHFGYGMIRPDDWRRSMIHAHRASWEIHFGPVPSGLHVLHRCDNPPCTNPDHLFVGTDADNAADKKAKGRARAPSGEAHRLAKLTEADVREIKSVLRSELRPGLIAELARRYGVTWENVKSIATGRTWRNV